MPRTKSSRKRKKSATRKRSSVPTKLKGTPGFYVLRSCSLKRCGFSTYSEYLASDLWKEIRTRVLQRDRYRCRVCGKRGHQVHHESYGDVTLRGERIDKLLTVCRGCHLGIEFSSSGTKIFNAHIIRARRVSLSAAANSDRRRRSDEASVDRIDARRLLLVRMP